MSEVRRVGGLPREAVIRNAVSEAERKGLLRRSLPQVIRDVIDYQEEANQRATVRSVRAERRAARLGVPVPPIVEQVERHEDELERLAAETKAIDEANKAALAGDKVTIGESTKTTPEQ